MSVNTEVNNMQAPDPDHALLLSKWAQEIIFGLIAILMILAKFIGKWLGGNKIDYATREELQACNEKVSHKIDKLGDKIDKIATHLHERIDARLDR